MNFVRRTRELVSSRNAIIELYGFCVVVIIVVIRLEINPSDVASQA